MKKQEFLTVKIVNLTINTTKINAALPSYSIKK